VAIRTDRFKLIVDRDGEGIELYDLAEDPIEQRDVAATRPDEVARLRRLLAGWRRALRPVTGDQQVLETEIVEGLRDLGYID